MEKVKRFIIKNNSISLNRFINLCLYKKDYGYYHKQRVGNDFVTSPEISQMFGECISIFFITLMKKLNVSNFCELGPGNGTLANDIIRSISKLTESEINFYLYEKSNFFDHKKIIKKKKIKVQKLEKLKMIQKPHFFICNEFFDALPINQIKKINGELFEKRIKVGGGKFISTYEKLSSKENSDTKCLSDNQILEISPLMNLYLKRIFRHIKAFGGGILIFDYGPLKKKKIDTLQAIHKKKKCEVLDFPFKSDITYHIDFEKISELSNEFGLKNYGPIHQKKFLYFYGINERLNLLLNSASSASLKNKLYEQFIRLTDPKGMGELIKCMFICNKNLNIRAFNN